MTIKKRFLNALLLTAISGVVFAQNGVNSPYSRYGFGQLSDQSLGTNAAMGGVSYGLRTGNQVNTGNPASYSACDSLTFLFDAGMSIQNANFDNGTTKLNAKNASLDYVVMQFRAFKNVGVSFGFLPFSKIGYNYSSVGTSIEDSYGTITPSTSYTGEGGLTQAYLGIGTKVINNLSIGANLSYLFGDITHSITNQYSESSVFSNIRTYSASISSYKLDLGLQYELPLGKEDKLTLGATYSLGHKINKDAYRTDYLYNTSSSSVESTSSDTIANAFELPQTFGVGFAYQKGKRWTVAADYTIQKWGDVKYPMTSENGFVSQKGFLSNRKKASLGVEFVPNAASRKYLNTVRYRVGGYCATPYAKVDGVTGGKEYGLSAGFGLPIVNGWNNRSVVNIAAQWVHVSPGATNLIKENYLRLCVSLTFNERWFMKWKVE